MDFFKPGSFSILKINPDGSLTEIESSLPDFLTDAAGETSACDCPPGMCLGEAGADFGFAPADVAMNMIFDIMGAAGADDDEIEIEEEDHPVEDYRADAIAQLGRITEGLAEVASIHARLVAELVGS